MNESILVYVYESLYILCLLEWYYVTVIVLVYDYTDFAYVWVWDILISEC